MSKLLERAQQMVFTVLPDSMGSVRSKTYPIAKQGHLTPISDIRVEVSPAWMRVLISISEKVYKSLQDL